MINLSSLNDVSLRYRRKACLGQAVTKTRKIGFGTL